MRNNVLGKTCGRSQYSTNKFFKDSHPYFELSVLKPLPYYQPQDNRLFGSFMPSELKKIILLIECSQEIYGDREMGEKRKYIVSDPSMMMGKPVITGTRITVELILEKLAAGRRS